MKVYCVFEETRPQYGTEELRGIFETEEKAEEFAQTFRQTRTRVKAMEVK